MLTCESEELKDSFDELKDKDKFDELGVSKDELDELNNTSDVFAS